MASTPLIEYTFNCPKCGTSLIWSLPSTAPILNQTFCAHCCTPLVVDLDRKTVEITQPVIRYHSFFSHSLHEEDKNLVSYFECFQRALGIEPYMIERDPRPIHWTQKIAEKIPRSDFVFALVTKRYKYEKEGGYGWKGSEFIQDELTTAYNSERQVALLAEKGIDLKGLPYEVYWCHYFERSELGPLMIPNEFLANLDNILRGIDRTRAIGTTIAAAIGLGFLFWIFSRK